MFVCKLLNLKHYSGTPEVLVFSSEGANGPKPTTALETFEIIIIQLTHPSHPRFITIITITIIIIIRCLHFYEVSFVCRFLRLQSERLSSNNTLTHIGTPLSLRPTSSRASQSDRPSVIHSFTHSYTDTLTRTLTYTLIHLSLPAPLLSIHFLSAHEIGEHLLYSSPLDWLSFECLMPAISLSFSFLFQWL